MSTLVTLDEIEEYEREVLRAHAENRAPRLRNPYDVHRGTLGNVESNLQEKSKAQITSETKEIQDNRTKAEKNRERLQKVVRGTISRRNESTLPAGPADPKAFEAPKTKEEKEAADREAEAAINRVTPEPVNVDKHGNVEGDSVNPKFVEGNTFDESETIRNNMANAVPVPERFRNQNPPQVIQQGNPITGEAPTDEVITQRPYVQVDEKTGEPSIPDVKDVPHTAISIPRPNNVIGDETGTTREPSLEPIKAAKKAPAKKTARKRTTKKTTTKTATKTATKTTAKKATPRSK